MDDIQKEIDELIAKAKTFTFANFSTKNMRGYPAAYLPEWIIFRDRCTKLLDLLDKQNDAARSISRGLSQHTLGFGEHHFQVAHESILHGLQAARAIPPKPEVLQPKSTVSMIKTNRVFIVHGHDHTAKNELEIYLKELGLDPIVLHRQPDEGKTIIEKFEKHSDVGYAFILLTPDEMAYPISEAGLADSKRHKEPRARPNVIFEFGYFIGRLGRPNVCCLYTGNVEVPSDVRGFLYKEYLRNVSEVFHDIRKELLAQKYQFK